jgi:DNA-binding CsgD family transcriptional regulator
MMSYVCLVQELWRLGRYAEVEQRVREGIAYARERELDFYLDYLVGHRHRLELLRGDWAAAEAGLRGLLGDRADTAGSARHSLPALARLLVRRGADDAERVLARAGEYARRADSRYELVPTLLAEIEQAWLTGRPESAAAAIALLDERTAGAGPERQRAELLRWRRRLGERVAPFPGCPPEFAAGLRGDWRAAAAGWQRTGNPYAAALELTDSGDVEAVREGLRVLDDLGARPAAALARRTLRGLGVPVVPRGPKPTTRTNPAGLTDRQLDILRLLAGGRTNAEIAARLVVSVRTVDHHVSAVLQKLGVTSRRDAVAAAATLGIDTTGATP